jgi:hypothetical protein
MGRGCHVGTDPEGDSKSQAYADDRAKNISGCPTGLQFGASWTTAPHHRSPYGNEPSRAFNVHFPTAGHDAPFEWGCGQQIWDRSRGESADDWYHPRCRSPPPALPSCHSIANLPTVYLHV